jgi:hypothetical protein
MADVDRGQLILVTALAIAVSLVALVLLLNTVIYAENLATRGADVGGQDAIEYRSAVVDGVGGAVDAENDLNYESHDAVRQNVSAAVERVDTMLARQHLRRAELVEISNVTTTEGALLLHPEDTGSFENDTGASTWTLATDVPATRGFAFVLNDSVLATQTTDTSDAFRITVDNGSAQWAVYVYDDGGAITVAVDNETDPLTDICSTTDASPRLDLTAGTLAGDHCPGLAFGEGVDGQYDIEYTNADHAAGTYNLTVQRDPDAASSVIGDNFDGPATGTAPYYAYAVYDATVDVRYRADGLRFTDRIRVARGEPT